MRKGENMKILGIESSCDETAAAVVEDGRIVHSSVIASQIEEHKLYGGVVPEIASRRHSEAIVTVTQEALAAANCTFSDLDGIAVTYAPGLIGALLVGVNFAKGLSLSTELPLIPVHHLRSHIASNYISHPDLKPPFLCLVVSGGHTHIILVKDYTKMEIIGCTRDDAAGEAFDKAARSMGMPYPGGVHLDKVAEEGDETAFQLPHPKVSTSPYDFSFSGLKTAVVNLIHNSKQKGVQLPVADLSASFRRAVVDCLTKNVCKAMEDYCMKTLVIAGGVSANRLVRREFDRICKERGWALFVPELSLCGDNAAMVGSQGYYEFLAGNRAGMELNGCPAMSIE
jgi:N6-L-threonylcarbamoyladenine synthase